MQCSFSCLLLLQLDLHIYILKKKKKPLQFTVVLVLAPVVQNKQDSPALLTLCISLGTIFSSFDIPLKMIDALGMIAASCRFRVQ